MTVLIEKNTPEGNYFRLECPAHFTLGHIAGLWGRLTGGDETAGIAIPVKPRRPILSDGIALEIPVC